MVFFACVEGICYSFHLLIMISLSHHCQLWRAHNAYSCICMLCIWSTFTNSDIGHLNEMAVS